MDTHWVLLGGGPFFGCWGGGGGYILAGGRW